MIADFKFVVPDASVVIKLLVKENEDVEATQRLKADFLTKKVRFEAPFVLQWEVGNYLGRSFDSNIAIEKWAALQLMKIRYCALSLDTTYMAFQLMEKIPKASFYDASYHSLALQEGALFLTCDQKYYERARHFQNIMLLGDYPLTSQPDFH